MWKIFLLDQFWRFKWKISDKKRYLFLKNQSQMIPKITFTTNFAILKLTASIKRSKIYHLHIYCNLFDGMTFEHYIALRIFMTIPVINCSVERSYSWLKRIKTTQSSYDSRQVKQSFLTSDWMGPVHIIGIRGCYWKVCESKMLEKATIIHNSYCTFL